MAKGSNDLILRDRLQFETNTQGDISLVYGRIDLSDYVSIPENKGLAIKEIRFQFRDPDNDNSWPLWMNEEDAAQFPADRASQANIGCFATTTAYENARDVGIASPNVLSIYERVSVVWTQTGSENFFFEERHFGTPDLHPDGYDVVTDLLIGVYGNNLQNNVLVDSTLELDVMVIAEPKKITQKDLTQMLAQAQDV